jgi:hypothetical protein
LAGVAFGIDAARNTLAADPAAAIAALALLKGDAGRRPADGHR